VSPKAKKQSPLSLLIPMQILFVCCLVVGFFAALLPIGLVDLGRVDCGSNCVVGVPPYHSQDGLALTLYWLFVIIGSLPLLFTARKIYTEAQGKTLVILAASAFLLLGVTGLLFVIMFPISR
jgi:hypothetical protein